MKKREISEIYLQNSKEWREWLEKNHDKVAGVYLIFYTVDHEMPSMRWEEAVMVALCFGWIDSTTYSLGNGKRRQYFTRRKSKSNWSAINKSYIDRLLADGLMHESGMNAIAIAKENGSWNSFDDVEKGIIPEDLKSAFKKHPEAFANYQNFAPSYRKSYLYWLQQAKRPATRTNRLYEIIDLCKRNIKSRQ
ncbi:YdeI/OmpD-associated family protein [Cyclobacterium sp.]|uniref:YdeI/OmpD-associated family protein n=1 Tax=Cyclobacterium sp. TaxID=1966343 RepID=UPI0019B9F19A|nr:YdeI/OmpD-associated family protein [Cyclobacterium sp.]MBD3630831.1 YdeI/OmpD-associated family protein [Cyclobacterium sp.]